MREREIPVEFEVQGKTVYVLENTTLVEAAAVGGISLNVPCGGQGTCGKCRVRVHDEAPVPTTSDEKMLSTDDLDQGWRLACQTHVQEAMTVTVPKAAEVMSPHAILVESEYEYEGTTDPVVRKQYVELTPPSRDDSLADLERLEEAVGSLKVPLETLRILTAHLRGASFRGTAVIAHDTLIDFEEGNTEDRSFSVAVDIGTTTLAASLMDLTTGDVCASTSRTNAQIAFGDDVLTRITHSQQSDSGLSDLHMAILNDVNEMIGELAAAASVDLASIYELVVAGNTTMQQAFLGLSLDALGKVPFTPAAQRGLDFGAAGLGIAIHPRGRVYCLPVMGGFLGGDAVASILATSLAHREGPVLLIDIGTNGEVVLGHEGRLIATSTAAGPAFEGARIKHGMRAAQGAIEKVILNEDVHINVIGNTPPVGLCGSALIDAAAGLLDEGLLVSQGELLAPEHIPESVSDALVRRVVPGEVGYDFVLATTEQTESETAVVLTQKDIRELQLATAAIRAATTLLLARADLEPSDLKQVLVGGGFGNFIRRSKAQRIGLLPPQVAHSDITFVGNTALAGAQLAAVSKRARLMAEDLAAKTERLDLSFDPAFHTAYVESMFFPEGP